MDQVAAQVNHQFPGYFLLLVLLLWYFGPSWTMDSLLPEFQDNLAFFCWGYQSYDQPLG
jgi:hypothetical protein